MGDEQHEFENFLRGFQPMGPSALPQAPRHTVLWVSRSAAVTTLTLAATVALGLIAMQRSVSTGERAGGEPVSHPARSSVVLTRLAVENPERFDKAMAQQRLPRFDRQNSALHFLARD
jgi:hypothetical protein